MKKRVFNSNCSLIITILTILSTGPAELAKRDSFSANKHVVKKKISGK